MEFSLFEIEFQNVNLTFFVCIDKKHGCIYKFCLRMTLSLKIMIIYYLSVHRQVADNADKCCNIKNCDSTSTLSIALHLFVFFGDRYRAILATINFSFQVSSLLLLSLLPAELAILM